ncbi:MULTISPECIES: DUF309 domain-containing protein [Streptomyces]|uniref:DUF309 domain-containing protein n=1 Tax=Streptomyces TaxID=1883 RepID=UPI001E388FD0|nr:MULTISPECIES: DUF309 domain-containing protein [Streptomyces]UFQ19445.1 DUF309 domain-containing protein [Streptomyces huasconensis]WCL89064.1 DUF309 domain-containing protein [Streptomyces sp. JCM 35825]
MSTAPGPYDSGRERDRDEAGRARNQRPRDGLGRPLPYGTDGVARQPEGVVRTPEESVAEAQALLDAGRPFHAHEVFEDAWKSGPPTERDLWKGLAQLAVGLTHAARGNTKGGARLLLRGAGAVTGWRAGPSGQEQPYGLDLTELVRWAEALADLLERESTAVDAAAHAPRLRGTAAG